MAEKIDTRMTEKIDTRMTENRYSHVIENIYSHDTSFIPTRMRYNMTYSHEKISLILAYNTVKTILAWNILLTYSHRIQ